MGTLRLCPQGLFSSFLTFLRPNFFPAPSNCPWVSEDGTLDDIVATSLLRREVASKKLPARKQVFAKFSEAASSPRGKSAVTVLRTRS